MKRRNFLKHSIAASVLFSGFPTMSCSKEKKLKILVLGGTNFVGPAIVASGLKQGHDITLFNRGITNPDLFSDLKLIKGNRENGPEAYAPLKKFKWDVVIDVWPEHSKLVDEATLALQNSASRYLFISSIGVYQDFQEVGLHENSELVSLDLDKTEWGYPEEKVASEQIVADRFPKNHLILRAGPITGWRDPAVDLLFWLVKLKNNQDIIAPGSGQDPLQFINVKDVGKFAIYGVENQLVGTYNCTGPMQNALLWETFLTTAKQQLKSSSQLVWINEAFLKEHQVRSWEDLPLWAPLSEDKGFMQISNSKATQAGFEYSDLEQTISDCLAWHEKNGNKEIKIGIDRSKELEVLEKWRNG